MNLPRHPAPLQLLQVFAHGQPCGWLGKNPTGFWFHYHHNGPQQHWVSLLMPPTHNFYQQRKLFQVFAQHLPSLARQQATQQHYPGIELGPLDFLCLFNDHHLGPLRVVNPDNPVVRPLATTQPSALSTLHFDALIQQQPQCHMPLSKQHPSLLLGTQARKPFADTLIYSTSSWPLLQGLQTIKAQVDPNNRLRALRWANQSICAAHLVHSLRPDLDFYQQGLLGFEHASSLLNVSHADYQQLLASPRCMPVLTELARTYCKNFALEIALLQALETPLRDGQLAPFLVYSPTNRNENTTIPTIFGLEYLLI